MKMSTVSTKQLRQNFSKVIEAMRNGQSLLLLYRSRPLAELKPITQMPIESRSFSQKQIRSWLDQDRLSQNQLRRIDVLINRLP